MLGAFTRERPALALSDIARAVDVPLSTAHRLVAELCAWGVPSILVPLPTAAANHQHHNAVALAEAGAAVMIEEKELGGGRLWREMMTVVNDPARLAALAAKAKERGQPDAADLIVRELARLIR